MASHKIELTASDLTKHFAGFHVGDGVAGTLAAVAYNENYTDIINDAEKTKAGALTDVTRLLLDDNPLDSVGATARYALLKPYVVWVRGPLAHLPPTLCTVEGQYVKTNVYKLVTQKARRLVNSMYKGWKQGKEYEEDFPVKAGCLAETWHNSGKPDAPFQADNDVAAVSPAAVAALYLAARVQHICDVDGGKMFRDRMGLAAAAQEFSQAAHTLLFA